MPEELKSNKRQNTITGLKEGDLKALEKIYKEYGNRILNYIRSYFINDPHTAEDLLHDTFISVYNSAGTLRDETKFLSWVYRIAANKCKNYLRKKKRILINSNLTEHKINDLSNSQFPEKELFSIIHNAIDELPVKYKEVYIMHEYHKMKYEEISDILKCSLRTVKYRMEKAFKILIKDIKE